MRGFPKHLNKNFQCKGGCEMAVRKSVKKLKTYLVGYKVGMSSKTTEIKIKGLDCFADDDTSSTTHGQRLWLIIGRNDQTVFQIPVSSLLYCVAESSKAKKKEFKAPFEVVPIPLPVRAANGTQDEKNLG